MVIINIISNLLLRSWFFTSFLCVSIPLCPELPVWVQRIHHHLRNPNLILKFELFSSLLLVYLSFCLQCRIPSCLKTRPVHRFFLCQIEFSICQSSFTLLRTSSLVTLSSQLIFSILLHINISKASNFLLSVWVNIHVSAANSATLQTRVVSWEISGGIFPEIS